MIIMLWHRTYKVSDLKWFSSSPFLCSHTIQHMPYLSYLQVLLLTIVLLCCNQLPSTNQNLSIIQII
uniref:Uncharacterized protein n=1 Tax=Arundo donax TaxID=35708 RepID=A0A0A8Z3N0_ARUDO